MNVHPLKVSRRGFQNFCYLVTCATTKRAIVIDPAWQPEVIEAKLAETGTTLQAILLTHSHYDHVNLAESFARKHTVPVYMSRDEIDFHGFRCSELQALASDVPFVLGQTSIVPFITPGHTAGSTCYLIGDCLFSGDTLFSEGCGICSGRGGSAESMYHSIQFLKHSLPPLTRIYPGHSFGQPPGQTLQALMDINIYLTIERCDHFVKFRTRPSQSSPFRFA